MIAASLALLIAVVIILWCLAQLPVTRLGMIFPASVKYLLNFENMDILLKVTSILML